MEATEGTCGRCARRYSACQCGRLCGCTSCKWAGGQGLLGGAAEQAFCPLSRCQAEGGRVGDEMVCRSRGDEGRRAFGVRKREGRSVLATRGWGVCCSEREGCSFAISCRIAARAPKRMRLSAAFPRSD
eukprot:7379769-Prymnesium_polylepis.1